MNREAVYAELLAELRKMKYKHRMLVPDAFTPRMSYQSLHRIELLVEFTGTEIQVSLIVDHVALEPIVGWSLIDEVLPKVSLSEFKGMKGS